MQQFVDLGDELIPTMLITHKAGIYGRQSTESQGMTNLESQWRQYDLVDVARQLGFMDIEVIDDGVSRSLIGTLAPP